MKMQCSVLAIILVGVLCMGAGFGIGKATQPITVNNISESRSYSSSDAISVSGTITVNNDGVFGVVVVDMDGYTNVMITTVSNRITNQATNYIQAGGKIFRFMPMSEKTKIR